MVQTITARSDGSVDVNTGTYSVLGDGASISSELQTKFNDIVAALSSSGGSEIHAERDTFREFEHIVKAAEVTENSFGTTISAADFDWIMSHIDTVAAEQEAIALATLLAEQEAAAAAAEQEAAAAQEPT